MKVLFTALFLLILSTCVPAQLIGQEKTKSKSSASAQVETEDGTHYAYSLRTNKVERWELLEAFAIAAEVDINARFSGDWSTTDDDGIEYYLNTRRNLLRVDYDGDDSEVTERAKQKVAELKRTLGLE